MRRGAGLALIQTTMAAALWGTSFPAVSLGLESGLDPRTFVFLRFALAAPIMIVAAWSLGRTVLPLLRVRAVWIIGALNAVGFLCQFIGQQYTTASVAALLVNMSVVFAAAGSAIFLGEKLGGLKVAGVVLAVIGTLLIITNGDLYANSAASVAGDGLYLVAAAAGAGYILYAKKKTDQVGWDPVALAACVVIVTAILVLPAAVTAGSGVAIGEASLAAIAYTAMFNTAIPFVLYQQGLRHLTASSSAVVLMLGIVVAVLISVAFLGETLTPFAWVGALAVLVSIVLVSGVEIRGKTLSVAPTDVSRMNAVVCAFRQARLHQVSANPFERLVDSLCTAKGLVNIE